MTKKWAVLIEVYATTRVEVEADNAEDAEKKAYESAHVSICHQCADHIEIGELGEVYEVTEIEE